MKRNHAPRRGWGRPERQSKGEGTKNFSYLLIEHD